MYLSVPSDYAMQSVTAIKGSQPTTETQYNSNFNLGSQRHYGAFSGAVI